ncbi:nucleolar protein 6-like [Penaeus japonicus]|uniref:nucleolar protein 6-like n=1 Tax=Penaeus japonicus TaxID=27405 RepID=UPI001C715040|nr:nucleolar protein 6-like [Penaeus japonicus]
MKELSEDIEVGVNQGSDGEPSSEDGFSEEDDIEEEDGDGMEDDDAEDDEEEDDEEEEGEEDDGMDENEDGETEGGKRKMLEQGGEGAKSAKKSKHGSNLYKPPTVDELNTLRETQMLYHSNLFRMQMEEVLGEVSIKTKHSQQLEKWMAQFSAFVKSLPASQNYKLESTDWMEEKNIRNPMPADVPKVSGTFLFLPPKSVQFTGSFLSNTATTQNRTVDVMLVLPRDCVHAQDWQNGRWLVKRVRYLSWLAAELREKSELVTELSWTTHLGCESRPLLQVTPAGGLGKKWKVNLFPVPSSESFRMARFAPTRGNIHPKLYLEDYVEGTETPMSPFYNWACGIDIKMEEHTQLVQESISQNSNITQGIKLIKIWLAQRKLDTGIGCMSGHMVSLLVIHLLRKRKINTQMSAYQVYRNIVLSISTSDWTKEGFSMGPTSSEDAVPLESYHNIYEVVFVDPSGMLNLTAAMSSIDFLRIKHEAELAMKILDSSATESFESLFIRKIDLHQMCDQLVSVQLNGSDVKRLFDLIMTKTQGCRLDRMGDICSPVWTSLLKTLKFGLSDRVTLLAPQRRIPPTWPLDGKRPNPTWVLDFGLVLHPTAALALLTKGPSADSPEVKEFQTFWGKKSTLRRFQDGSFHEAILWADPKEPIARRRLIPGDVIKQVLQLHFGIQRKKVLYVGGQMEKLLHMPNTLMKNEYGTGEEVTTLAIQAFDRFARKLRSLELPLKITTVHSTSEVSRHARVFPPLGEKNKDKSEKVIVKEDHMELRHEMGDCPPFTFAINVIVFLEMSGKWPDDVLAIQAIKAEFYKNMSDLLEKEKTRAIVFPGFLQVLWEGYVFRVEVCYRREIYLQRLVENADGDWREKDTEAAINLEKQMEMIPKITTSLASIQSEHPSFSAGVRLAKRWVASQMMLGHFPHLAVELLVAHLYQSPDPYLVPHTPHVTLLRFMHLLAHTDWSTTPIFVNLSEAFTVEDQAELSRRFTSQRESLPHMFIATPHELRSVADPDNPEDVNQRYKLASVWTKSEPTLPIIYRIRQLAGAALSFISESALIPQMDFMTLFRPSLVDFDVTITLNRQELSRRMEAVDRKNLDEKKKVSLHHAKEDRREIMPIVMYDAAFMYLGELREAYNHLALFFYDEHGGDVIGVVWNPKALTPQELKIGNLMGHKVVGVKEVKQVANVEAIIEDFRIIGTGLVESISIKNE